MKFISKTSAMLILSAAALGAAGCAVEAAPDLGTEADGAVAANEQAYTEPAVDNAGSAVSAVNEKAAPDEATQDSPKSADPATQEDVGTSEDPFLLGGFGGWGLGWGGGLGGLGGWGGGFGGFPAFGLGAGGLGFGTGFGWGW